MINETKGKKKSLKWRGKEEDEEDEEEGKERKSVRNKKLFD